MMGGPFVSHAVVDKAAGKVYVFEGFVYRPNEDKLHLIRMMESSLYSFRPSAVKPLTQGSSSRLATPRASNP